MRQLWDNHKYKVMLFLFVLLLLIPTTIHILFKTNAITPFLAAEWSAGDILNYYGVIIGAIMTVAGVFFTIQYSQANYRQDTINRCLPFMTVAGLQVESKAPSILGDSDESKPPLKGQPRQIGEEYRLEKLYFVINRKKVKIQKELNAEQQNLVAHKGMKEERIGRGLQALTSVSLLYTPLEIQNVGIGAATVFSVGLYPDNAPKQERLFSLATSLKAGESYRISIYSENWEEDNVGDYNLCISYYDILGNGYEQNYTYTIFKNESDQMFCSLKMNGTQKRVKGGE